MNYNNHKKSKTISALWLGMAVFFLFFCSSPVKRYIRLHLYDQKSISFSNSGGDRYNTYDAKDCLIADRHLQSEISIASFAHSPSNEGLSHDNSFFISSIFQNTTAILYFRNSGSLYIKSLHRGGEAPLPLYLWVRHLQV